MTKHEPKIMTAESLYARCWDCDNWDDHDFSAIMDDDGNSRTEAAGKYFVVTWPDHCVTEQHIGDAAIHGPYGSREVAAAAWGISDE